jgi:hypothetical protein
MPPESDVPRILVVDDEGGRLAGIKNLLLGRAQIDVIHPLEIEVADLEGVDLISVDEYLGDAWAASVESSEHELPASLMNADGLAVAAAFRSQERIGGQNLPLAITLHTGAIKDLSGALPEANRESLTAAQHDLEWVFEWDSIEFPNRLIELASAARSLINAEERVAGDFGAAWLHLPDRPWTDTAIAQIEDCRPPAHSLARNSAGRSYLRWLAHRVLPYPTFLLTQQHGANLLGIQLASFDSFAAHLKESQYDGPLSSMLGERWWRAGLQQVLVDSGVYQWDSAKDRAAALSDRYSVTLQPLTNDQPVVSYDANGHVFSIDTDSSSAVRIQQDGWPVWADDPWATFDQVAADPSLRLMVTKADRRSLPDAP